PWLLPARRRATVLAGGSDLFRAQRYPGLPGEIPPRVPDRAPRLLDAQRRRSALGTGGGDEHLLGSDHSARALSRLAEDAGVGAALQSHRYHAARDLFGRHAGTGHRGGARASSGLDRRAVVPGALAVGTVRALAPDSGRLTTLSRAVFLFRIYCKLQLLH